MAKESAGDPSPIVIAHRGASGYLPEHTAAAKALAYGMGSDFLEQDVVLSRDGVPVVLHDIHVDTVTDVAVKFPDRKRSNGRFYAIDLTFAELKTLSVRERFDPQTGRSVYPGRFPGGKSDFLISSLAEEIELIQGLNSSTGKDVGIYPEIKKPAWHRAQGQDISKVTLEMLMEHGYNDKSDRVYVQCFDPVETRRMRDELDCHMNLVQLIGENAWGEASTDFDVMRTPQGLREIAQYADGIGPAIGHVVEEAGNRFGYKVTSLVPAAHELTLEVHPYTARVDDLPPYVDDFDRLIEIVFYEAEADGIFADFPDLAVAVRERLFETR